MDLYQHQIDGVDWLTSRGHALLLDEQGLGKTVTAIVAAAKLGARRVLVICPTVVLWNWRRECFAWWPQPSNMLTRYLTVEVLDKVKSKMSPGCAGPRVVVTTHGLITRDGIRAQLLREQWDVVIVDEAHCFKTRTAQRTRALYFGPDSILSRAERLWALSGTIMPNDASELWTHLFALFPERIANPPHGPAQAPAGQPMSFQRFRARYCRTTWTEYGDHVKIVGNRNIPELRERLDGAALRRREREVLDLPPMRFEQVTVRPKTIPAELRKLEASFGLAYDALTLASEADVEVSLDALATHESMAAYRRLCGMAKIAPTAELLAAELETGALDKVVVFAHHTDVVYGIAHELREFGVVTITGETPAHTRAENVETFQERSQVRVLVGNLIAAGVGITLTAATEAVFAELSFVPGENAQAAKRIHRIGQDRPVRARFLALDGFIDEGISGALRRKTAMIREVLDA